ncbi:uncharacterized protein KQ657_004994 [Scheffersomyces spartinae]|uniref:Uncharacterized protein n=1 Tax=Scheffersomyces spartinae TaxID=45513 RepID=A0A9P8AJM4_9ASCO|nr:uncharacterized protein KQ657_004994 [Scheffersomyces spartinae]KAG7194267.1 hypothetical protein KQ657_004994 [Scheffersomyces spartinae]
MPLPEQSDTYPSEITKSLDDLALVASQMSFGSSQLQTLSHASSSADRTPERTGPPAPRAGLGTTIGRLGALFSKPNTSELESLLPFHSCPPGEPRRVPQNIYDLITSLWVYIAEKIIGPCYNNRGFLGILLFGIALIVGSVFYFTGNTELLVDLARVFVCFWWPIFQGGTDEMERFCRV